MQFKAKINKLQLSCLYNSKFFKKCIDKEIDFCLLAHFFFFLCFKGIGGHGGTGIHADLEDKYNEIMQRISHYSVPETSSSTQGDPAMPVHSSVSHKEPNKGEMLSSSMQQTLSNTTPTNFQRFLSTQGSSPNLTQQFPTHSTHYPRTTPAAANQNTESFSWRCGSCNLL